MNTILVQELLRFNVLLSLMKTSLSNVQRALKGLVVMSAELELMGQAMVKGRVPSLWKPVAYESLKPLGSWVLDLIERVNFFDNWTENGKPTVFLSSAFFFVQAFLTGCRQNCARKHGIAIDEIGFDFLALTPRETAALGGQPEEGAYINGLFCIGCDFLHEERLLAESRPKVLHVEMPVIHLIPMQKSKIDRTRHQYSCPVYKTSERRGMLSTTGHSTNFVMYIELQMKKEHTQKHWIKRGVALITTLDD